MSVTTMTSGAYREAESRTNMPTSQVAGHPIFSPLDLSVIGIGRRDRLTVVPPESLLGRLQRLLFGVRAPLPFADRRLEALRRLALAFRRPGRNADVEVALALQAGVTPEQIQHLRSNR